MSLVAPLKTLVAERKKAGLQLSDQDIVRSNLFDQARALIETRSLIIIFGPPRTGKTTLALQAAREALESKGRVAYANCLDMKRIPFGELDPETMDSAIVAPGYLLLLDDWHVRPDSQEVLADFIRANRKAGSCIILVTTRSREGFEVADLPSQLGIADHEWSSLNTAIGIQETARGMVRKRLESVSNRNPHIDIAIEDEIRLVLEPRTPGKTNKRNLRELEWRLNSWQIGKKALHDVDEDDVIRYVRAKLLLPAQQYTGTLERIATLAQWEMVLEKQPGGDPPPGVEALIQRNLVYATREGLAWTMDPTDACLCLYGAFGDEWISTSMRLLLEKEIPDSPAARHNLVWRILTNANHRFRSAFFKEKELNASLTDALREYILEELRSGNDRRARTSLGTLFREIPEEGTLREANIRWIETLIDDQLLDALASISPTLGLTKTYWIIRNLQLASPELTERVRYYLAAIGEDNLCQLLEKHGSLGVQLRTLDRIERVDRLSAARIRLALKLAPAKSGGRSFLINKLARATLMIGKPRRTYLNLLEELEFDDLEEMLLDDPKRVKHLSQFLNSVEWLAPTRARRLAADVEAAIQLPLRQNESIQGLSLLLVELNAISPLLASTLATRLTSVPLAELISQKEIKQFAYLMLAMERVVPGLADSYIRENIDAAKSMVIEDSTELKEKRALLALLSDEIRGTLFGACRGARRAEDPVDAVTYWAWSGIGRLCKSGDVTVSYVRFPSAEELAASKPVDCLLAIYALEAVVDEKSLAGMLAGLPGHFARNFTIPPFLARNGIRWEEATLVSGIRGALKVWGGRRSARLRDVVLAARGLTNIEFSNSIKFDIKGESADANRAIRTAIATKLLLPTDRAGSSGSRWTLSPVHALATPNAGFVALLLGPLRDERWSTIAEWFQPISKRLDVEDQDYWCGKLIQAGMVDWRVSAQGPLSVEFKKRASTNAAFAYQLLHLPIPSTMAEVA